MPFLNKDLGFTEAGVVTQAPAEAELVNMTFRAHRYGADAPCLAGRDLHVAAR